MRPLLSRRMPPPPDGPGLPCDAPSTLSFHLPKGGVHMTDRTMVRIFVGGGGGGDVCPRFKMLHKSSACVLFCVALGNGYLITCIYNLNSYPN